MSPVHLNNQSIIIGLMSGTSLDGLDIAACKFRKDNKHHFDIVQTEHISYDDQYIQLLKAAPHLNAEQLIELDYAYGKWLGQAVNDFCRKYELDADLLSCHGHTIFHRPEKGFTYQIGDLATLGATTGMNVVGDFRTPDLALGGQGAPLVPIGDALLFSDYDACLNLGGIANISYERNDKRIAYDICPFNLPVNHLANTLGQAYDDGGAMGKSGQLIPELLEELKGLDFFNKTGPKSLGREWLEEEFMPIIHARSDRRQDLISTLNHLQAILISREIPEDCKQVLITGGGAYNAYVVELLEELRPGVWIVPQAEIVEFKEAIVFAFLGWLRAMGEINTLASVTGASHDHSAGTFFLVGKAQ